MRESGYYPPGAEFDPNAPYNQVEPPELEYDCCVSYTLERESTLTTSEVYWDTSTGNPEDDRWELCDDADRMEAYEWNRVPIPELLDELVKYIDKELNTTVDKNRKKALRVMRESATGWKTVDKSVEIL